VNKGEKPTIYRETEPGFHIQKPTQDGMGYSLTFFFGGGEGGLMGLKSKQKLKTLKKNSKLHF
jgi:hypothetical protein